MSPSGGRRARCAAGSPCRASGLVLVEAFQLDQCRAVAAGLEHHQADLFVVEASCSNASSNSRCLIAQVSASGFEARAVLRLVADGAGDRCGDAVARLGVTVTCSHFIVVCRPPSLERDRLELMPLLPYPSRRSRSAAAPTESWNLDFGQIASTKFHFSAFLPRRPSRACRTRPRGRGGSCACRRGEAGRQRLAARRAAAPRATDRRLLSLTRWTSPHASASSAAAAHAALIAQIEHAERCSPRG